MMKKTYMAPTVEEVKMNGILLLGVSGEGSSVFNDLGGGGVDVGGVLEPDAPAMPSTPEEISDLPF